MTHVDPEPAFPPVPAPDADVRRPAVVTVAGTVMLLLGAVGGVVAIPGLFGRLARAEDLRSVFGVVVYDFEFQYNLLLLCLSVGVVVLAIQVWLGNSIARLAAFAALGSAAAVAGGLAASFLASVAYGIDQLYEDRWQWALITMWAYLFATVALAAPLVLLNRPAATKWFRRWRSAPSTPVAADPAQRPQILTLVRTALIVLAVLIVISKGWDIGTIVSGDLIHPADIPENLIRTLANVIIPLLIFAAAIIEIGSGSRLGQTTAFAAAGYACLLGLERFPSVIHGAWLDDWHRFGELFTAAAIGLIGAATLLMLLRPRVVDYLAHNAVDLDLDYSALEFDEDEDEEADDHPPAPGTG